RMMMEMGVYSEADYEQNGTGAYSHKFKTLIANHLMYADTAEYGDVNVGYIGYTDQQTLYSRIRKDMVAGRPAVLSYSGHSFVGDGLGTMGGLDYYHLNYGWGGSHNGWYLLTDGYNSTVIITATTGIMPRPVAVFKPMSVEQSAAFTLEWDFPKRLTAEGFRLTRITGDHSFVVSSSIDGKARSYNVTGQSGTATYTLEAMIDGNWQEVSEGVTVTVKSNPTPMLDLMIDDELNSVAGLPFTMYVAANNTLQSLSVSCSRPDMVPNSSISVSGTGTYRTVSLTPSKDLVGNAILYLTGVDTIGNVVKKTVLLRIQEKDSVWQTNYADAQMNALLKGKLILLVAGRQNDVNTITFLGTVSENADIKANLLANYEVWFADVDASTEYDPYVVGLGNMLPLIAIIDPAVQDERLRGHGGPMTIAEGKAFLDKTLPLFSLQDEILTAGMTHELELSVLDKNAEIRYRLDAKDPTANDLLYTEPIPLKAATTVSARTFKYGVPVSATVTKRYTFLEQVATPLLNVGEQKYFSDIFLVTAFCPTSDATIRYTTDGTIPTESSSTFPAGDFVVTENMTLSVRAFKNGMKPSECVSCIFFNVGDLIKGEDIEIVGEETGWFLQKTTYNSAPSAMQSKAIGDYGVATMTVKVVGSGTIKFHWKVSSEENKDLLTFAIDNVQRTSISGNKNWAQQSYSITGDGEHTLVWTYSKNYRNAAGSDCGWVDDIVWTPSVGKKLVSIAINGASNIAIADTEIYVCMATWDDGSMSPVTPSWSLSEERYAVLSNGRVTNKNTTEIEQTVALEASYTSGGVTRAAVKNITLAKRGVASIAISGDTNIANGGTSNYVCTATMSDGETVDVTPVWSLSSTQYASVDADGIVTNRNTTEKDQTVTLTADYTSGGVTKTASIVITLIKRTLVSISITGDNEIAGGETAPYVCTATWSDGAAMPVTPSWSLSSTQHASVDAVGKVTNRNVTETNQSVTLTASYTSGGITLTASKAITLTNRFLVSIAIAGDNVVATAAAAPYGCTATWSDGATTTVSPTWSLSSTQYATMDAAGKLTNKNATDNDQTVTLTANYTSGGVTMTASRVVTLAKRSLMDIAIAGEAVIANAASATYECAAVWSVGESSAV
ncbi:MAG: chitobiase/beta-hexosaminidase C-terminal domain-containing protein, partial [Victivallales bacterium]|nr:chitobiase/beta-hexosaminidase C-terminal domain-containing protein [Victivallales bacterium]